MLGKRIITALILAPLAIAGIFLLPNHLFAIIFGAVFLVGAWEWARLLGGTRLWLLLYPAIIAALMLLSWLYLMPAHLEIILWLAAAWWLLALVLVALYPKAHDIWYHPVRGVFIGLLVFIPSWAALVYLQGQYGPYWVMLMMFVIWGADTGAYFSGRALGRHKLAPRASPGKTWEGVVGGLVVSVLVSWGIIHLFELQIVVDAAYVLLVILVVMVSIVGDLLESIFKRQAGVKDSGSIFPGHGGVLDRLDSLFAAAPVFVLGILLGLA